MSYHRSHARNMGLGSWESLVVKRFPGGNTHCRNPQPSAPVEGRGTPPATGSSGLAKAAIESSITSVTWLPACVEKGR